MIRLTYAVLFLLLPYTTSAEVYRCAGPNGRTVYQSRPCENGVPTGIDDTPEPVRPVPHAKAERKARSFSTPESRTRRSKAAKSEFQRFHPCPSTRRQNGSCPGYVIDHVTPLACGGADAPSNMQWQTRRDAKEKDRWEREMCVPIH